MNWKKITAGIAIVTTVYLYIYLSSPDEVAVKLNGEVSGMINNLRESVQGKRFWLNQINEVSSELEWELDEPRRQAQLDKEMDQVLREVNEVIEDLDKQYPELQPSAAERQAEALRDRADQIEQAEMDRFLEKLRLERIDELRKILAIVKIRAK